MTRRGAALLVAFALALPAHAASEPAARARTPAPKSAKPPAPRKFVDLKSGKYVCELSGMLCTACAGMIVAELKKVSGVEAASVDFDERLLRLVILPKRSVRVDNVKRALAHAARRIDLGTNFGLVSIRYVP
ncbi:MAG: heavy-metal-associated domain-containing protein [Elusimicrobia bacterium]|nr:heavy-metal-associated domain-containing protein [Elusimicrobiota bacterium]